MFSMIIIYCMIIVTCISTIKSMDEYLEKMCSSNSLDNSEVKDYDEEVQEDYCINRQNSDIVKLTVPHQSNITYGPREGQILDIYGTTLPPDADIFVILHGGVWQIYNKDMFAFCAKPLYDAGIKVIVPDYDLAPKASMTTMVTEIKELGDYVLALAEQYNSRGVWFGGHSAGAHLAAQLLTDDYLMTVNEDRRKIIKGFVLLSGIYDLRIVADTPALHLTSKEIEEYSIPLQNNKLKIVHSMQPAILVTIAQYDTDDYRAVGHEFVQFLANQGIDEKFLDIANETHYTEVRKLFYPYYNLTQSIISMIRS